MIGTSKMYGRWGMVCGVVALAAVPAFAQQRAGSGAAAEIGKVRTAYETAGNAQDGAALAKLFAADGTLMPPHAPVQKGRAAIEAYYKNLTSQVMIHGLSIKPTETRVLGDVAYDIGTYSQALMPMKGGKMVDDKGKYITLLKKEPGGSWTITHSIYNSDLPLPAPAAK